MRLCVTGTLICVMGVIALGQDHLATLGISEGRAKEAVFDSFVGDTISLAGKPAAFLAMSPQQRVSMVNFALAMSRSFVESDDFKRRYADHREANGPDPLPEAQTADQIFAKQRAGFENQVAEMKKLYGQITPEQIATLEAGWNDMRKQLDEMEKGEKRNEIEGLLRQQRDEQERQRNLALQELDKTYPADARAMVAQRLRRFLDVTKDVNYDAQLVESAKNGAKKKVFADAALEAKPAEWKLAFRAGKPATEAARTFAQKWLNDLQAQGVK